MRGLMQQEPLTITGILERALAYHPHQQVVTKVPDGIHRETYQEMGDRARRLAGALRGLGIGPGDRVGTLGFNTWRHLELYFAVPCMGSVLHTLNIRLHPDQISFIADHGADKALFVDGPLAPLAAAMADKLRTVEHVVAMGSDGLEPLRTAFGQERVLDYEALLDGAAPLAEWPDLDENDACMMCYTSGTTGHPKGVLYSHRSMVLHTWMLGLEETIGGTAADAMLPVVPMFHANGWGMPFSATMIGAKHVYPGAFSADPAALADLIESERVTILEGVPTVWIGLLQYLKENPRDLSSVRRVLAGGSAVPVSLIESFKRELDVDVCQGWGMTETSPVGSLSRLTPRMEELPEGERFRLQARQGRAVPGVHLRVTDVASGQEVPPDNKSMGEVQVRGNWIAASYYGDSGPGDQWTDDGWFKTGDVAVIDESGFIQIVDRTKDLVKSGGEWISSVELESALMGHPAVLEAAVIAVPDERYQERPLACVVLRPGASATEEELRQFLVKGFPKFWVPDHVAFLEEIPKTSVGKFNKRALRQDFKVAPG